MVVVVVVEDGGGVVGCVVGFVGTESGVVGSRIKCVCCCCLRDQGGIEEGCYD